MDIQQLVCCVERKSLYDFVSKYLNKTFFLRGVQYLKAVTELYNSQN